MRIVEIGGNLVEVHVRRSERVRGSRAVFRPGEPPEIVVRTHAAESEIDRAIVEHRPWLGRQLSRAPAPVLELPPLTEAEGRRQARAALHRVCAAEAERIGVAYRRIAIRDQRSRWGSCSSAGTLSFSWRLALAPAEVLEYVAVHELCHLRVPNHSQLFWRLVEAYRPGYAEERTWLARHGWELLTYVPARG